MTNVSADLFIRQSLLDNLNLAVNIILSESG